MSKKAQNKLWEGEWWEEHWQGMPEFYQEDKTPFASIIVHFKKESDVRAFAKLLNQRITYKTKYIYYPEVKCEDLLSKMCVYKDES